ncbi:MAG: toprim domain-containing protein [Nanoarchaeota archaeon]
MIRDLNDWVERLKTDEKLKIVEGKKDKMALERLGIKNIMTLSKPIYKVIEDISKNNKECIILVDLDSAGRKIYGKLKCNLQKYGVRVDDRYRIFLFKNTKIRQIEGLIKYNKLF